MLSSRLKTNGDLHLPADRSKRNWSARILRRWLLQFLLLRCRFTLQRRQARRLVKVKLCRSALQRFCYHKQPKKDRSSRQTNEPCRVLHVNQICRNSGSKNQPNHSENQKRFCHISCKLSDIVENSLYLFCKTLPLFCRNLRLCDQRVTKRRGQSR